MRRREQMERELQRQLEWDRQELRTAEQSERRRTIGERGKKQKQRKICPTTKGQLSSKLKFWVNFNFLIECLT